MICEWMIVRNAGTLATADALDELVAGFMADTLGAPRKRLAELSGWLVARENSDPGTARQIREFVKSSAEIAGLLAQSGLALLAGDLIGAPARLHEVVRLRTVMRDFEFTHSRPHQDIALWPNNPNHVNLWLALCDVTEDLAPLQIAPESSGQILDHTLNEHGQHEISRRGITGLRFEAIALKRGEAVVFSPSLIHCSAPNQTESVRWSLDFRFAAAGQPRHQKADNFAEGR